MRIGRYQCLKNSGPSLDGSWRGADFEGSGITKSTKVRKATKQEGSYSLGTGRDFQVAA